MRNRFFNGASRSRALWAALFCAVLFASCSAKTEEAPVSDLSKLFTDAGLRLLREGVQPRDFTLPLFHPTARAAALSDQAEMQTLSDLKGKVVFLNFWATWCGPCRIEMPSMESLYNRFKDRGFEMMAVNCMEGQDDVLDFMTDNGLTFPVLLDEDGRVSGAYGIQAIPTTYIIDREGKIIMRLVGSIDWDTEKIHAAFDSLLGPAL